MVLVTSRTQNLELRSYSNTPLWLSALSSMIYMPSKYNNAILTLRGCNGVYTKLDTHFYTGIRVYIGKYYIYVYKGVMGI